MSDCYLCERGSDVIETHHIVPKRFDGSDGEENLVDLCPTCHRKIESLYDKRFYDALGVEKEQHEEQMCIMSDCTKKTTRRLPVRGGEKVAVCDGHVYCSVDFCGNRATAFVRFNGDKTGVGLACEAHSTCAYGSCNNHDVEVYPEHMNKSLCDTHAEERS